MAVSGTALEGVTVSGGAGSMHNVGDDESEESLESHLSGCRVDLPSPAWRRASQTS